MRYYIVLFVVFITLSCRQYENQEIKAINDISNDYLFANHLPEIRNEYNFFHAQLNPYVDTSDLKVYISLGLLPLNQIKQDNDGLFSYKQRIKQYDSLYYSLLNSKGFKNLKYRYIDESKLKLRRPYFLVNDLKNDLKKHEVYVKLIFSRVCFDKEFKYGLLYLDYNSCYENGSSGSLNILLIQKIQDSWVILEKI